MALREKPPGKSEPLPKSFCPTSCQGTGLLFQDEYGTTKEASENLRASGKRTKSHRPIIDQAAAVIILQSYLDSQQPRGLET